MGRWGARFTEADVKALQQRRTPQQTPHFRQRKDEDPRAVTATRSLNATSEGIETARGPVPATARTDVEDRRNGTERRYGDVLEFRKTLGEIRSYRFETMSLRLAKRTWYRPDYFVQLADGTLEIHEVKGRWREDARAKIKVAAFLHPEFRFRAVREVGRGARRSYVFENFEAA